MGLLYQRYLKFNEESYSLSNSTLYNIFGEQSVRLGRYKMPLSSNVILSITDPLTYTEMQRYLTSFNPVKWFVNQYFQQKRKRSYILDVKSDSFFTDAVHYLEYGRLVDVVPKDMVTIPIQPIDSAMVSREAVDTANKLTFYNDRYAVCIHSSPSMYLIWPPCT